MRQFGWKAMQARRWMPVAGWCVVVMATACQREGVSHVRVPKEVDGPAPAMGGMGGGPMGGGGMGGGQLPPPPPVAGDKALQWLLPPGWTARMDGGMRYATLTPPQDAGKVEVSVVTLAGPAGGELANVNRWRGQLGLPPVEEAALAGMRKPLRSAAGPIALYDFESEGQAKTRTVAALLTTADGDTWFLKMTGDSAAAETQMKDFGALLMTLHLGAPTAVAPASAPTPAAAAPAAPAANGAKP